MSEGYIPFKELKEALTLNSSEEFISKIGSHIIFLNSFHSLNVKKDDISANRTTYIDWDRGAGKNSLSLNNYFLDSSDGVLTIPGDSNLMEKALYLLNPQETIQREIIASLKKGTAVLPIEIEKYFSKKDDTKIKVKFNLNGTKSFAFYDGNYQLRLILEVDKFSDKNNEIIVDLMDSPDVLNNLTEIMMPCSNEPALKKELRAELQKAKDIRINWRPTKKSNGIHHSYRFGNNLILPGQRHKDLEKKSKKVFEIELPDKRIKIYPYEKGRISVVNGDFTKKVIGYYYKQKVEIIIPGEPITEEQIYFEEKVENLKSRSWKRERNSELEYAI